MDAGLLSSPRFISVSRVPTPVYAHIFAAAAEFYRLTPWVTLGEEIPIEIKQPPGGPGRVVVVTGVAGDVFGLTVYDSIHDLKGIYQAQDPLEIVHNYSWMSLCFESPTFIAPEDLEVINEYGWLVANQEAYPVINRMGAPDAGLYPPTKEDLFWLEAALPALNKYFRDRGASLPDDGIQPQELTMQIQTSAGPAQIELRIPAQEINSV
jgi:hypothetical protein